jgi:glycosyltransferase involved in cell wall biosynthesis
MSNLPLVSIITVVYNGSKTIEQTIQSVLNQTYSNIEYIIIDGGSTDSTVDIIKKYDNNISQWVSEPDKGLYDAMNKGISKANGEIIGMINSDDWYEVNASALIVDAFQQHPEKKIFHGNRFDVKDDGSKVVRKFNPSKFKFLYYGMTYNHPSMFIHKDIYKYYKYNPNLLSHSDYEFVLTQFLKNKSVFYYLQDAYVNYRLEGVSNQIGFWRASIEVFKARLNSGLPIYAALFSFILMRSVKLFYLIVNIFKFKNSRNV